MRRRQEGLIVTAAVVGMVFFLGGCGTVRETFPDRSAMEQLLLSTAADRAIDDMEVEDLREAKVFLEFGNLDSIDRAYVRQALRDRVLGLNAVLVSERDQAEVVLELASGGLSMDKRDYLLGIPSIPIPTSGGAVETPEVPIFKAAFYRGKAKLLASALDPSENTRMFEIPMSYGRSMESYWWILLFGPFKRSNLAKELH